MVKNKDFCGPEKIICHILQKLFQAILPEEIISQIIIFFGKYTFQMWKNWVGNALLGKKEREGMIVGEDISSSLMSHSTTSIENFQQSLGSGSVQFCQEIWWGVEKLGH